MKTALVTGSGGLIGSETARMLCEAGWEVAGFDNDMRGLFFGQEASTAPQITDLCAAYPRYRHYNADIRDRARVRELLAAIRPDFIVHTAGQPSHDLAASIPYDDFDVNAGGTFNLLAAARDCCPEAPFCFTSTNKVYGDRPNLLPLVEQDERYEYADGREGVDETMSIDACLHSLFGASKASADLLCQEFGRYFGMPVGIFRAGCLTGPQHAAVELHGYLAYIVTCAVSGRHYTIHGYKGKQVRDQLHSRDLVRLFLAFYERPRCGEVYNVGGGRKNNISILETIRVLAGAGYKLNYDMSEAARKGDHICYVTDLGKVRRDFPDWQQEYDMRSIIDEVIDRKVRAGTATAVIS